MDLWGINCAYIVRSFDRTQSIKASGLLLFRILYHIGAFSIGEVLFDSRIEHINRLFIKSDIPITRL